MAFKSINLRDQSIALSLTFVTCAALIFLLWLEIHGLNLVSSEPIRLHIRWSDILVGMTIYLKTSIDFAIFIGRLMEKNQGLRGRIGIEVGTAVGNAAGTMAILLVWTFFKEVDWLLAIMIVVAAFVLIRLAEDSIEHIDRSNPKYPQWFRKGIVVFDKILDAINKFTQPVLGKILPSHTLNAPAKSTMMGLLALSFSVPFILGLDDFAGYVPLFNVVNVFGFGIGVFAGHMVLNIFLYLSPKRTIATVKNPIISLVGAIAFVILAGWGIFEAAKLFLGVHG